MTSIRLTGYIRKVELEDDGATLTLKIVESTSILFNEIKVPLPKNADHNQFRLGQEFVAEVQFVNPEFSST